MDQPWKTDDYFVSPWNYQPEVTAGIHAARARVVHDVTLRDGEQQAGVVFTPDDKRRIAEALAEAGVDRIEAGLPAVSPADMRGGEADRRRRAAVPHLRVLPLHGLRRRARARGRGRGDRDGGALVPAHHRAGLPLAVRAGDRGDGRVDALRSRARPRGRLLPDRLDSCRHQRVPRPDPDDRARRPHGRARPRRHVRRAQPRRRPPTWFGR